MRETAREFAISYISKFVKSPEGFRKVNIIGIANISAYEKIQYYCSFMSIEVYRKREHS